MSRREPDIAADRSRRWKLYWLVPILVPLCVGLVFFLKEDPEGLLQQGVLSNGSEEKIELLKRAIAASGGDYPKAEIELCIALARTREWNAFSNVFSGLDLTKCAGPDLLTLARLCVQGKQWEPAERVLSAVDGMPHSEDERLEILCGFLSGTNRIRELINTAEELTRISPADPKYWWQLASIHEQRENRPAAIQAYQAAIQQPLPKSEISRMRHSLLNHCIDTGDAGLAREQLRIVAQEETADPRIDVYEARLCHLEGRPAEALVALERALRNLGDIPEALRLRGILFLELEKFEQAVADLTRVISLSPQDEIAFFKLSQALRRHGQTHGNTGSLELAVKYHQEYVRLHNENLNRLKLNSESPKLAEQRTNAP